MTDDQQPVTPGEIAPTTVSVASDWERLRRLEIPPGGSRAVRVTVLIGVVTLLVAVCGLVFALIWTRANEEQTQQQLACSRESAVEFDSAIGESVELIVLQLDVINGLVVAISADDQAAVAGELARLDQIDAASTIARLGKAVEARDASLAKCR